MLLDFISSVTCTIKVFYLQTYSIRTRGRAVEIFSTMASMIAMIAEYNRPILRSILYPTLPVFTQALVKGLQTPDGFTSDSGLKKEILKGLHG